MKKGYLEISFAWIFAIIVGVFVISLSIYGAVKILDIGGEKGSAATAQEIRILLNTVETGFETGKTNSLTIRGETRIYNSCDSFGSFGLQRISVSQFRLGEWTDRSIEQEMENRYVFSKEPIEGRTFYLFSKPLELPYKLGDLIYMTSSEDLYCFSGTPEKIKNELNSLNQTNIKTNCSDSEKENSIRVCFVAENCDIRVDLGNYRINKDGKSVYFVGDALMYAAIFSDTEVYECQLNRLIKRMKSIAVLYQEKSRIVPNECNHNIDFGELISSVNGYESSSQLVPLYNNYIKKIKEQNQVSRCRMW